MIQPHSLVSSNRFLTSTCSCCVVPSPAVLEDLEAALRAVDKVRPSDPLQAVARWLEHPEFLKLDLSLREVQGIVRIQARYRGKLQRSGKSSSSASTAASSSSRSGGSGGSGGLLTGAILSRDEESYSYLRGTVMAGLIEPLQQCAVVQPDDPAAFIAAWLSDTTATAPTSSPVAR